MADAVTASRPSQRSWLKALAVYCERRSLVMLGLGFASGLPFLLIFDTLSAWLRQAGLSLEVIAFFSLASLVYAFKFLWAPLVDRTAIPILGATLGHRRSWMVVVQIAVMAGLCAVASSDPQNSVILTGVFAVLTGFAGATQDIVIDAWRIEAAPEDAQGAMAAVYQLGYRIAFLTAGAAPLFLADAFNWSVSYIAMAALMSIGIISALLAPRERAHVVRQIPRIAGAAQPIADAVEWLVRLLILFFGALLLGSGLTGRDMLLRVVLPGSVDEAFHAFWSGRATGIWLQLPAVIIGFGIVALAAIPLPGKPTQPGIFLRHALGDPIMEFLQRFRREAVLIMALICFYRISDFVLIIMNPFYLDLGFSLTQIAEIRKIYGAVMYTVGAFAGGYAVARWGLMRALVAGSIIAPLSNLTFAWLATLGPSTPALILCLAVNNVALSFAGTCLIAYMSSLTSAGFTATQYALFSSLYALPDKIIMTQSGRIVEAAARSADSGGWFAPLRDLMRALPDNSYTAGATNAGVAPASLGAGYIAFFVYSCLIGFCVVPLAVIVSRRPVRLPAANTL
jgi:MFS transporter, PAT family, beta-lactamase induction signal transducer AmpG